MRISDSFFFTRREFPKDETSISSKLLIKSGMILKNNNGIYSYMPFGIRVLNNIERLIRKELYKNKANEVSLPSLVTRDVFEHTEREKIFGDEIYNIIDRNKKTYTLCPTSEELFAYMASSKIQSYKDLHFTLFQFGNKYRDEENLEYGLIRTKEFYTMDGCSFDANEGGLDVSYDKMYMTFRRIFNRLGLDTLVVESDATNMKGISSEEFQVLSKYGDNEIVKCDKCTYACNIEDASSKTIPLVKEVKYRKKELVKTPNAKTIKEVSEYLDVFPDKVLKSLIVKVDDQYKMILLKGNSELNIKKLKKLFKTNNIEIPDTYELEKLGTIVGYIGPIGCTMEIIADNEVKNMHNFVCGSNKKNYHYINVNYGKDFKIKKFADLKLFDENSLCPKCKNKCSIVKGIEVGQIYKLGINYSDLYKLVYTDEVNKTEYVHMGSYQIGLDRCLSAIVESHHDEDGIIWPVSIAPFKVAIVVSNVNDQNVMKYADLLHDKLEGLGIDTLLDDRKETIGVKFNDMDLIGIPYIITIGKNITEEKVELKTRKNNKTSIVKFDEIDDTIQELIKNDTHID